jgi:hypothetical protein
MTSLQKVRTLLKEVGNVSKFQESIWILLLYISIPSREMLNLMICLSADCLEDWNQSCRNFWALPISAHVHLQLLLSNSLEGSRRDTQGEVEREKLIPVFSGPLSPSHRFDGNAVVPVQQITWVTPCNYPWTLLLSHLGACQTLKLRYPNMISDSLDNNMSNQWQFRNCIQISSLFPDWKMQGSIANLKDHPKLLHGKIPISTAQKPCRKAYDT